MPSERIQRRIDRLLDEAEAAADAQSWAEVARLAREVLGLHPENEDAPALLRAAEANLGTTDTPSASQQEARASTPPPQPESFAAGRYQVRRFLGEGGRKRVFLAHDALLDRDVAFALIKTDGLDDVGRQRIVREAQAMGRMGAHPHLVSVFDLGEEQGAPYVVTELMQGGDVEGELERAGGALELPRVLEIATSVARGLAFAHERGIVHRDLKPGNVWLTADGTAKIGDFGLAVAEGRSRLTQHGMMVGTFAYMPPEQALGGEATPRSDLYSLGAMLYELVTGRPPFQGDSPTAVISQHLNAAPVAPSWHTEHCPPALEDLVLALLAKDPASRPASAADVLAVLERIDPEERSRSHSDSQANPLDALAHGTFVGRTAELERLRQAFDAAAQGHGSVAMLVGEPGIGKTRTVRELETYARMRGAYTFWGRTHEAAGAPPYWPWVQVGNAWGAAVDLLGTGGASLSRGLANVSELSRLFPALRQFPGFVEPEAITDPNAAQFRLFDAYTQFLRNQSQDRPWLVVLDDLHWADAPTLKLLQHVARELPGMRLLVVGTYRDTDIGRQHPLSESLAALNREGGFQRLVLRGLSREEVAAYLQATAGVAVAPALVERIHEETEGNPFFLAEVVNLLVQEGTLSGSVSEIALPDGVKEALGRRLDRLSEEANALLAYAAVAGREFSYETLQLVRAMDDDALLKLLEEALAARVIEETGRAGRYRFTHALMQETLLDELSTTRRVRMHGELAEALERHYADRADDQAPRLALHFAESATLNAQHAARAVHYLAEAGRQAAARFAWTEAVRLYQQATVLVGESSGVNFDEDVAELYAALAWAADGAGELRTCWRALMIASQHFRERKDGVRFAETALLPDLHTWGPSPRVAALWLEAINLLGIARPDLRARLAVELNRLAILPFVPDEQAAQLLAEARPIIEVNGSADLRVRLDEVEGYALVQRGDFDAGIGRDPGGQLAAHASGHLAAIEAWYERRVGDATYAQTDRDIMAFGLADIALLRGDLDSAERLLDAHSHSPQYIWGWLRASLSLVRGDTDAAVRSLPDVRLAGGVAYQVAQIEARAVAVLWEAERRTEAAAAYQRYFDAMAAAGHRSLRAGAAFASRDLRLNLQPGALGAGAASMADATEREALRVIIRSQPGWTQLLYSAGFCPRRVYGDWAVTLDMSEDAERLYLDALAWCERERCPVEAGRCHQGLAEVAERRGQHTEAMAHLDAAGELFARHGAKLYLDQVIAKKQILKA